ncbi:hypothetical protein PHMEG_0006694 [Phytophthora megakarya]|uniref:Uncharacterized protein n=1 Tax=Phytophthora megakarya TaxID=4795 RepID=A0A225WQE9_9STRA|nr:hypothetical protein PHMEG_0006694 [Phytophthora megakarya]
MVNTRSASAPTNSQQRSTTKHINTISNWIQRFEADNDYERRATKRTSQFTAEQREWLLDFYTKHPFAFLDEAKAAFEHQFARFISATTVWRALRQHELTWKVLERRTMRWLTVIFNRKSTESLINRSCEESASRRCSRRGLRLWYGEGRGLGPRATPSSLGVLSWSDTRRGKLRRIGVVRLIAVGMQSDVGNL